MYDFLIVGGGIVGLSTAEAILNQYPHVKLLVVEKEASWGAHQTGHNSGVIHSGIYYKPGSLKAKLATEGNRAIVEFCEKHGVAYDICGKVIVATEDTELPLMKHLYDRGRKNGIDVHQVDHDELHELEPHVQSVGALHVPVTGIVNYKQVCDVLAELIQTKGAEARLRTEILGISEKGGVVSVETDQGTYETKLLVNCAGLHSDRVASMAGGDIGMKIVPFRGEYYELKPEKRYLVKNLIYPVPNPEFPFLGVHFTRMIDGRVEAGPNAVLSMKREGYAKTDINFRDLGEALLYPGFWRLAGKYWREGVSEMWRSFSKAAFVRNLQRLIPEIEAEDLEPAPAGVRAQALKPDGTMVDDFYIVHWNHTINVCNAPSPAATASLKIGEYIASEIAKVATGVTSSKIFI
ncbi:L-2-hydroxyglutarate oxidase [Alicyclobacillus cycloheptanicus]|uniref:L-2-hydroxyglutarate oxidase n=1 Tax=Alicyclobacillus cycloheptanicus TaxID=1457 RepID=A0ABT9XHM5_9BACL|nr:L-2-hydroxyglutarate oxidase [Alicyclobacillus cycloheptanicus]MDQ0189807.1 L-2-hydroxyglutarate oxidase [Alicyclobacillus cycloheptanicus]WDM02502.1 L-2-hydroxyglutarate oxidase [Alicyclobacillus cycloheptanicus]